MLNAFRAWILMAALALPLLPSMARADFQPTSAGLVQPAQYYYGRGYYHRPYYRRYYRPFYYGPRFYHRRYYHGPRFYRPY